MRSTVLGIAALGMALGLCAVAADELTFTVTNLTNTTGDQDGRPTIAVDPFGAVHMAHSITDLEGSFSLLRYTTNASGSWQSMDVPTEGLTAWDPPIAVDAGGTVHLLWDAVGVLYHTTIDGGSANTSSPTSSVAAFNKSLVIDGDGHLHGVFESPGVWPERDLRHITNASGSWVDELIAETTAIESFPTLAVDENGHVHVAFLRDESADDGVYYATNSSGSWVETKLVGGTGLRPAVAVGGGTVHVAATSGVDAEQEIVHQSYSGGSWTSTQVTDNGYWDNEPSIALDSSGAPHIAWSARGEGSVYGIIMHAVLVDGSWVETPVTDDVEGWEYGSLALVDRALVIDADDYVHIALKLADTENEYSDLFYARSDQPATDGGATGDGTCGSPIPITCGQQVSGDTSAYTNNISAYDCSGWEETGPEIVYGFTVPAGASWTVTASLSELEVDLDVFILTAAGCASGQCLAVGNSIATAPALPPGDYVVVVDGFQGAIGTFDLSLACTPFQSESWLEIAAHQAGSGGSQWRTDVVVRNDGTLEAAVDFILHTASGDQTLSTTVGPSAMGAFEDVVDLMGFEGKGSLEVRSSQPVAVAGRIYNQADTGTFGQYIAGFVGGSGLTTDQSAWLMGLRQVENGFRTNISFTNIGQGVATLEVELFRADGTLLHTYTFDLQPDELFQDVEPFTNRAVQPNLGWGFARVKVLAGDGVLTSASVVDSNTNDATTIPMTF